MSQKYNLSKPLISKLLVPEMYIGPPIFVDNKYMQYILFILLNLIIPLIPLL